MADERIIEIVQLYVGRGLNAEPVGVDDDKLELSVNLADLRPEFDEQMLFYEMQPGRCWLPLTTTMAGEPELVWETLDGLIPTAVPVPHLGEENKTVKRGDDVISP